MAGTVNKVILVGNLGRDPEIRSMQSGDKVCTLAVATSEVWRDKATGERRDKTEWHRVVIFNQPLVKICESYLRKGSKVYLEGQLETRKWQDQNGQERYSTEVVLRPYRGELNMLDSRSDSSSVSDYSGGESFANQGGYDDYNSPQNSSSSSSKASLPDDLDDDIPF